MLTLYIANKNYSSWSLRAWLLMRQCAIAFEERLLMLDAPEFKATLAAVSPSTTVPTLVDETGLAVWDSLAIAETLAERFPDAGIWPADAADRARARCLCAEMHSGFTALRTMMPMNIEASLPGRGRTVEVDRDIERLVSLWRLALGRHDADGPFLFGRFCAADAFFAPVVLRLRTYGVPLDADITAWVDALLALPAMRAWIDAAVDEAHYLVEDEPYRSDPRRPRDAPDA